MSFYKKKTPIFGNNRDPWLRFVSIFFKPSRFSDRKSSIRSYFIGSSFPIKQWELCGIRAFPKQNQNSGLKEAGVFFQKMKNDITLRGDTSSQLDFNLAPQDIVLNCSDGQVKSMFVACILTLTLLHPRLKQTHFCWQSSRPSYDNFCKYTITMT